MIKLVEKSELPKEIFAVKVTPSLVAQAVRVQLSNSRQGTQSALTRAEVSRTRKKLYKQKGTGGARHGDKKAPIFVGGGVSFAPKPRDHSLKLSTGQRNLALRMALSDKAKSNKLITVSGMKELSGKTREVSGFLSSVPGEKRRTLIVTDELRENVYRACRNLAGVAILPVKQLNVYELVRSDQVIMMVEALKLFSTEAEGEQKTVTKERAVKTSPIKARPVKTVVRKTTINKALKK